MHSDRHDGVGVRLQENIAGSLFACNSHSNCLAEEVGLSERHSMPQVCRMVLQHSLAADCSGVLCQQMHHEWPSTQQTDWCSAGFREQVPKGHAQHGEQVGGCTSRSLHQQTGQGREEPRTPH